MHEVVFHPHERYQFIVGQQHREHKLSYFRAIRYDCRRDCVAHTRLHRKNSHRVRQRHERVVGNFLLSFIFQQKIHKSLGSSQQLTKVIIVSLLIYAIQRIECDDGYDLIVDIPEKKR